jgi:hypothetical protein
MLLPLNETYLDKTKNLKLEKNVVQACLRKALMSNLFVLIVGHPLGDKNLPRKMKLDGLMEKKHTQKITC